ncbi:restriction endonuclease [Chryseobacterium lacus]|uniref:Restriction endonuclease n=1 Tax=Chryseobacterium lacus TaxID=2058346 RepID=A0A368N0I5_9FLAO|nr:restriction endonuclease [Chryseobacterium lacus]RCU42759.1 restriction endonuclease [Chryseobacterium lacus]RST27323.1 restriction endonuclease [Chryseobacterium lacus]
MEKLTIEKLIEEAQIFCVEQSKFQHKELYGVTDGKAVGTLIEHQFQMHLNNKYEVLVGSSARGIDLPSDDIQTDIKVTSIRQPQSSCPFKDAKQKIFGLGYNLLVFVYDKTDDPTTQTAILNFVSCSFVHKERTADYTTTYRLREMVKDGANEADIIAYLQDKNIPADDITLAKVAEQILQTPPEQGYLTISNALQWRLQYQRIVALTDDIQGINKIISYNKPT